MKRTYVHRMVVVALGLLVLVALGLGPAEGGIVLQEARAVTSQDRSTEQAGLQQSTVAYSFEDLECGYKVELPSGWRMLGQHRDSYGSWTDFYQQDEHNRPVSAALQAMIRIGCGTKVNQEGFWDFTADEHFFNYLLQSEVGLERRGDPRYTIRKLKQTPVDGVTAVVQLEEPTPDAQTELTYAVSAYMWRGGRIYKISVTFLDQSLWEVYSDAIDSMLASLQFISTTMKPASPLASAADYGFLDTLKLPWRPGDKEPRRLTQDWEGHMAVGFALDFGHPNGGYYVQGTDLLAPTGGTACYKYDGSGYGNYVDIDAGNGWQVRLAHMLDSGSGCRGVRTGDVVGRLGGTPKWVPHIHVEVLLNWGRPDFGSIQRIFGRPRDDFRYAPGKDFYSNNSGSTPPCPTSGGVILYWNAGYNCNNNEGNSGFVQVSDPGFYNIPNINSGFNEEASSIKMPPGWSVKLFEHDNRGGGWVCFPADDNNFSGDTFNNFVPLNDKVSSFEVFHDSRCGEPENRAPNTPWPTSPSDGHMAHDGRAPTLCWGNPGDPDGNSLEFYAEVYDSPVNANSGWISGTCWRPSQLDGYYHNYKWHVKARDVPHHEESDWSDRSNPPWHFTIEDPNQPPSISFDTANGSSANRIESRERNWTFRGTASDPEGQLSEIEFRCSGDNCGSYYSRIGLGNWTYERHDMAGRNDVYFVAKDDKHSTASRHLDLNIDLAAPNTTISLNNEANPARWPAWFRESVQVRLTADDGNTGRARSGVKEIHYRLDSGAWQTRSGSSTSFTVSDDGTHTVEYYAVDKVGNQESTRSATFKIDQTPPSPPDGVSETHGVVSNQWQKAHNTPTFTWAASSDATSGVWGYQFYFGPDPNGVAYQTFLASDPREWTPQPGGVRTDTYYLRGRTRDNAGNWSAGDHAGTTWTTLFIFRYDGTPPENPGEAAHADEDITNDTWQRITNLADFTWPVPHDKGSGIKGYYAYWGADPAGTSSDFITANQYQSATPLCGTNEACTGYLRLRSVDNVDNQAEDWSTAFVLRYDNAPPTADFTFNGGVTQTTQTLVTLHITASDQGSGVREMRLSGDGRNWTTWEVYATRRPWTIPAISRQWWPVYLQVRDGMELESTVISRTIYLDVNPGQPRSENFRLFDHIMSAGAGGHASLPSGYTGRSTVGQVMDSAKANSLNYTIVGGYEAGSQALPIEEPGHDEFTFINGIFASGTGATTLTSTLYLMLGTLGEVGLPNNETALNSSGFQHQPGFLAAAPPSGTPTPTPTPGPTPTPTPAPACEFPRISINNAAVFTNDPNVTLNICAPRAREMMISNDGGFVGATWESYAETKPWTLTTYGQHVLPRFVYAAFKDTDGTVHGTYFDDIIHDPNPPEGTLSVGDSVPLETVLQAATASGAGDEPNLLPTVGVVRYVRRLGDTVLERPLALLSVQANGTVDIFVNAQDDNSGLAEMQISASADFSDTDWEPYSALKPWAPEGGDGIKTVYARFRDGADNISDATDASFALDTMPPFGGMAIDRRVVGPDIISTTVYLGAEDNLSGITDMRISADPGFTDIAWQPYTTTLTWPISLTVQSEGSLYVQYRDLAGNASEVYSDTYLVDTTPPVLYAEVAAGDTLTRNVTVLAYDELAAVETMHLSNDPLMIEGVVTLPYTDTVEWTFDERRVVWVQVEDSVGNVTEPYPAYAAIACPGDLDGNRQVNIADIMMVASRWRTSCYNLDPDNNLDTPNYEGRYDLDHDCDIDIVDIMKVAARWGDTCE